MDPWGPDGFRVLRGVLSADEVASIAAGFDRLEALARSLGGPTDVGGARFVMQASPFRLDRVVWCGGAVPELLPWGADPRFVDLACEVLGGDHVAQILQQAHFKLPGDGVAFGWHQDASNRRYGTPQWRDPGGGGFVQVLIAVDAAGPDNGGLSVIPGSHLLGFVADVESGALPPVFDPDAAVTPTLEPGDVLVFGPFLIHGSAPNRGLGPRRTLIQGYATPGANGRVYAGCGLGVSRSASWAGGAGER
jgi:hypothetical protein